MNWVETDFLVLRKTQHTGSNFIVAGISPDYGQIAFYVRPDRKEKGKFAGFDLFRKLKIGYYEADKELQRCSSADILADYGGLAKDYWRFCAACALAKFSLKYVLPAVRCPDFFRSLEVAFYRLSVMELPVEAVLTGAGLVFLRESGWLAEQKWSPEEAGQAGILLAMALGEDIPKLTADNWCALWQWMEAILRQRECPFPDFQRKISSVGAASPDSSDHDPL